MKNPIRQRTPLESGQVVYSINGVGDFTLGYSPGRHPEDDPLNLLVMYGRADDTDIYRGLDEPRPAAPHLYGIDVIGSCCVDVDDVFTYLSRPPDRRSPWWVGALRRGADGRVEDVPDGTRRRLASIVAAIAEDFLDDPEADCRLHAHRRHHAATRSADAAARLSDIEHEISTWQILATRERALIRQHRAWAGGQESAPPAPPPTEPHRDRSWRPLTHAGAHYLARSFPAPR